MDKRAVAIGATVGIGAAIYLAERVKAEEPGLGTLYGLVTDSETGAPIEGIEVKLNSWTRTTGADGWYEFKNIEPGDYMLSFICSLDIWASQLDIPVTVYEGSNEYSVELEAIEPPPVCTPGNTKCVGYNLYRCNVEGTGWDLVKENATECGYSPPVTHPPEEPEPVIVEEKYICDTRYNLYIQYIYSDGSTRIEFVEANSPQCGWEPPIEPPLPGCVPIETKLAAIKKYMNGLISEAALHAIIDKPTC